MKDKDIRQLFKDNADTKALWMPDNTAMSEDRFLEVVKQALHKSCVIESSPDERQNPPQTKDKCEHERCDSYVNGKLIKTCCIKCGIQSIYRC